MLLEVAVELLRTRVSTDVLLRLESLGGILIFPELRVVSTMDMAAMAAMAVVLAAQEEEEDACRKVKLDITLPEVDLHLQKVEQGELRIMTQETLRMVDLAAAELDHMPMDMVGVEVDIPVEVEEVGMALLQDLVVAEARITQESTLRVCTMRMSKTDSSRFK